MLTSTEKGLVLRLADDGLSLPEIVLATGFAAGECRAAIRRQQERVRRRTIWTATKPQPQKVGRCPECGARVELPCRECQLKAMKRNGRLAAHG